MGNVKNETMERNLCRPQISHFLLIIYKLWCVNKQSHISEYTLHTTFLTEHSEPRMGSNEIKCNNQCIFTIISYHKQSERPL